MLSCLFTMTWWAIRPPHPKTLLQFQWYWGVLEISFHRPITASFEVSSAPLPVYTLWMSTTYKFWIPSDSLIESLQGRPKVFLHDFIELFQHKSLLPLSIRIHSVWCGGTLQLRLRLHRLAKTEHDSFFSLLAEGRVTESESVSPIWFGEIHALTTLQPQLLLEASAMEVLNMVHWDLISPASRGCRDGSQVVPSSLIPLALTLQPAYFSSCGRGRI